MDPSIIIMVLLLVVLVFFMFRNKRKRDQQQADLQTKMVPGVEVMLTFGLYGTLVAIDEENNVAEVEIAPGSIVKVHRQTLGRVVEPVIAELPVVDDEVSAPVADSGVEPRQFGEKVDGDRADATSTESDKGQA
ncbi:preprotein translocase subunit YajC [Frigoribacterium sp. 2-23]|uniref:preprotein translocase subunit YajC n=1 Tax=Frigoribacterium sp. 2-23 TaxID=3415006 RepID=UPI003C6FFDCE